MTRAVGLLVAAATVMAAWSPLLGWPVLWACVVAVAAAGVLAWGRHPARLLGVLLLAWPVGAVLAAGVPLRRLWPGRWNSLPESLSDGMTQLTSLGPGGAEGDPWPLAVWLLLVGACWLLAAAIAAASAPAATARSVTALVLVVLPWGMAQAVRQTDEAPWQGAALVLAALLWLAPRRWSAARPVIVLGLVAALLSAGLAQGFGPRGQWFAVDEVVNREPQFRTLDTTQTYGPLRGRRTGATMLEVTAPRPALWRMQVLTGFSRGGWTPYGEEPGVDLPEPAAQTVDIEVRVRGLRNDLVISPGRVLGVEGPGKVGAMAGEAWRITPAPKPGSTYRVRASVVNTTPEALRRAPAATDPRLQDYTRLWRRWGGVAGRLGQYGAQVEAPAEAQSFLKYSEYGQVATLAQQLSAGANSQFEVVERIQRFLTEGGRFRYDTEIERSSGLPLLDFLLRSRVGYCQHFAGAAAMLLRLSGVPTRVAVGFATGEESGGHFAVRDADAHAWIEVYFQGIGWVPFNPTPAAADAEVAQVLDPFAPPARAGADPAAAALPVTVVSLALIAALAVAARRGARRRSRTRHATADRLLERLARGSGGQVTPATTLSGLRTQLSRLGPHLAEVAAELERERFALEPGPGLKRPRTRILRALAADVGPGRAAWLLLVPARSSGG